MKLSKQELTSNKIREYLFDFILPKEVIDNNQLILESSPLKVKVTVQYVSYLTIMKIEIKGTLTLASTRTLKPLTYPLNINDDLTIAYDKEEDLSDDIYILEGDELDLDELVTSLILSSLPLKIVGEDEKETFSGDVWEVITEDMYKKHQENTSPFSDLASMFSDDEKKS